MAYDYKELKDANGNAFKAAAVQVEASPNVVYASILRLDAEKAEDVAHASGDTGLMMLAVRKDTAAALAGTDGDYIPLIVDANGRLHVLDPNSATIAALSKAEDAPHKTGDTGIQILAVRKDTAAALAGTDGDYIPLIVDANGRLHVLDPNSATIAALSKAEDAPHKTGDTGIQILAVRKDTAEAIAGTAGDYAPLEVDALGRLHVSCHFAEVLDSSNDTINVNKMGKGSRITAATLGLNAVTATTTSSEINMSGHNYIAVFITVAGAYNWTVKLQGAANSGGTFMDLYDGSSQCSVQLQNTTRVIMWPCGAPYAKIVATEDTDGTSCTVEVVPFNR